MERDADYLPDEDSDDEDYELQAKAELQADEYIDALAGGTKADLELDSSDTPETLRTAFKGRVYENLQTAPILSVYQAYAVLNGAPVPIGYTRCSLYRIVPEEHRLSRTQKALVSEEEAKPMKVPDYFTVPEEKGKGRTKYVADKGQALVLDERVAFALMRWIPFSEFIKDPTDWRGSLRLDRSNENYTNFLTAWRSCVAFDRIQELRNTTWAEYNFFVDRWAAAYYYLLYLNNPNPHPSDDFYGASWVLHTRTWYEQLMALYANQQARVLIAPFVDESMPLWLYPDGIVPFIDTTPSLAEQPQIAYKPAKLLKADELEILSAVILQREEMKHNTSMSKEHISDPDSNRVEHTFSLEDYSIPQIPFRIAGVEPPLVELQRNLIFRVDISGLVLGDGSQSNDLIRAAPKIDDIALLNKHTSPLPGFAEGAAAASLKLLVLQFSILFDDQKSDNATVCYSYDTREGSARQWWRHRVVPSKEQLDARKNETVVINVRASARQLEIVPDVRKYVFVLDMITVRVPSYFDPRNGVFQGKAANQPEYSTSFLNQNNQVIFYMVSTSPSIATQQSLAGFTSAVNEGVARGEGFAREEQDKIRRDVARTAAAARSGEPFYQFRTDERLLVGSDGATEQQKQLLQQTAVRNSIFFVKRIEKSRIETRKKKGTSETQKIELLAGDWEIYFAPPDTQQADAVQDTAGAQEEGGWFEGLVPPPKPEFSSTDEDAEEDVNWKQLWNGAVVNCIQRCAFRCVNESKVQLPPSSLSLAEPVTIECNEDIINPATTGDSSPGFLGPSVPDDRHILSIDLLLQQSETAETASKGSAYQVASEIIMEEKYEPVQTGELKSVTAAELRSSRDLGKFFFTGMRQTGAVLALNKALQEENVLGNRSEKAANKQRARRVRTELVIENPKTKTSLLSNGKGGVNAKLESALDSWERDRKKDLEQEQELVRKQKEQQAGTTGGAAVTKQEQEAVSELFRQAEQQEQKDEAAAVAAQRRLHEASVKMAAARSKQYQKLEELPLNDSTRTAIKYSWMGFVFAYAESRSADPAEKDVQAALEIEIPNIYPPGENGIKEWVAFNRFAFQGGATPAQVVEQALRRQDDIVPEGGPLGYANSDPRGLVDALKYAVARIELAKRKDELALQQQQQQSSGIFGEEDAPVVVPVSDIDRLRAYGQFEWQRITQLSTRFKFKQLVVPVDTKPSNVFFGSFGSALERVLKNSYDNEKHAGAENIIIFGAAEGEHITLQGAMKQYGLEAEADKAQPNNDFSATYLRFKLAQWLNRAENREFLVAKMPYYADKVPLGEQEVKSLVLMKKYPNIYATESTNASLWVLQALCEIFLVRVVVMFSPESSEQVEDAEIRADVEKILNGRDLLEEEELDSLLNSDVIQFAVFEPYATNPSRAPVGWFRTIYASAIVVPSTAAAPVIHVRALNAIDSFSDEKVTKAVASQIAKQTRALQLRAANVPTEISGEELLIVEAGGYLKPSADPYNRDYVEENLENIPGALSTAELTEITLNLRELPHLLVPDETTGLRLRYQSIHDNAQINEFIRISISDAPKRLRRNDVRFIRLRVRIIKREIENRPLIVYVRRAPDGSVRYIGDNPQKDSFSITYIEQQEFWFALYYRDSGEVAAIPIPWAPLSGKFAWPYVIEHLLPELPKSTTETYNLIVEAVNTQHEDYIVEYYKRAAAERERKKKELAAKRAREEAELKIRRQAVQMSTTTLVNRQKAKAPGASTTPAPASSAPRSSYTPRAQTSVAPKPLFTNSPAPKAPVAKKSLPK